MNIMLSSKKIILTFFILTTKLLLYAQYIEYTENSFLIPYRKDTLWGLAYEDGKLSLEPNYNYCSFEDKNGNFFIKLDSKYGVISIFDSVVIPIIYDEISIFPKDKKEYYLVKKDNKYGILDENNKKILDVKFDSIVYYYNLIDNELEDKSYYFVLENNEWKFIEETGKVLFEKFSNFKQSYNNCCIISKNNKYGLFNQNNGKLVIPFDADYIISIDSLLGRLLFRDYRDIDYTQPFHYYYSNKNGNYLINSDGTNITKVDTSYNILLDKENIFNFYNQRRSDNFLPYQKQYNYDSFFTIKPNKDLLIYDSILFEDIYYKQLFKYRNGYEATLCFIENTVTNTIGLLDIKNGNIILSPTYDSIVYNYSYSNNSIKNIIFYKNNKTGFYSLSESKRIIDAKLDSIVFDRNKDFYITFLNNKLGIIDVKIGVHGELNYKIISPDFDKINRRILMNEFGDDPYLIYEVIINNKISYVRDNKIKYYIDN
jgi:hypothetical protein